MHKLSVEDNFSGMSLMGHRLWVTLKLGDVFVAHPGKSKSSWGNTFLPRGNTFLPRGTHF